VILNLVIISLFAGADLALGYIIYSRNKSLLANKLFLLVTTALTFWMVTNFFLATTSNVKTAYILNGLAYTFGFLAVYVSLLFANAYPVESRFIRNTKKLKVTTIAVALFSVLSATPLIAGNVYKQAGELIFTNTPLEILYTVAMLVMVSLIVFQYVSVIQKEHGAKRSQAVFIMIAFTFSIVLALIANVVLPQLDIPISYIYFGPAASLIVVSFIAYAITRHGLFDVRPFIARSLAYFFSIGSILGIFIVTAIISLRTFLGTQVKLSEAVFFAVLSVVLAVLFQPTKRFFDKISNNIFYRDSYNPQEVINTINSKLVNTLDLTTLLNSTSALIEEELKVSFCNFYLDPNASIEFHLAGSNAKIFAKESWKQFEEYYGNLSQKVIAVNDNNLDDNIKDLMSDLDIEAAVKMTSAGQEVGLLMVGERRSGNSFTSQDIQLLEIIADEVAIAVQNALRFEEISQFNITLQKKIDDATRELQKSNEKLQKLDEAKDEFISMASHQLRTPLTSVKGYISMMLEGDAGDITDQQKNFLDQAFLSSQRMVYLIADLLNVSRLKTGKFIIEPKPTYLPDVVESEIAQLHETAKARDLKLIFDKPDSFPTLNLDETKIRQVIMNFADNAIYYTPKGGKITINLKETDESIEYTVRDTGIGVPKSEQHHLFTKFYRAGNAKKARPDGTGLGLFMAKKVVVAQGGAIIFKTEEGKGSTFGFSFPRNKLEVEQQ
jgi:signal transduction histidine kinase